MKRVNLKVLSLVLFVALGFIASGYLYVQESRASQPFYPTNVHAVWPVANTDDVDAKTSGSEIITDTRDFEYHPYVISIETVESSGVVVPSTISIGTNSPDFNNIVSLATVGTGLGIQNVLVSNIKVPSSTEIKVKKVTTATATAQKFRVAIFGHLGFP